MNYKKLITLLCFVFGMGAMVAKAQTADTLKATSQEKARVLAQV